MGTVLHERVAVQGVKAKSVSVSIVNTQMQNSTDKLPSPLFDVYVNGISSPVHDHAVIKLDENRMFRIRVQNVGQTATDNVRIVFMSL